MMQTIVIVNEEEVEYEYGKALLDILKGHKQFIHKNKINFPTNITFRNQHPIMQAFNIYLKRLVRDNTTRIIISLK